MGQKTVRLTNSKNEAGSPYRYVLFYKPYNVLCQFTDVEGNRPTLKSYIPIPDIYAVGRLDYDSEGLLLLTNHGHLQHRLSNPKFQHPRTYWIQVERVPTEADLEQLRHGIMLQDYQTRPAAIALLSNEPPLPPRDPPIRFRKTIPTAWLEMTLTEGRNRQVRRMTAAIGFPTLRLVRAAIAHLSITGLEPGQWRELTATEAVELKELCQIREI